MNLKLRLKFSDILKLLLGADVRTYIQTVFTESKRARIPIFVRDNPAA